MTHFDCWASRFGETVTALELAPEGTGYLEKLRQESPERRPAAPKKREPER